LRAFGFRDKSAVEYPPPASGPRKISAVVGKFFSVARRKKHRSAFFRKKDAQWRGQLHCPNSDERIIFQQLRNLRIERKKRRLQAGQPSRSPVGLQSVAKNVPQFSTSPSANPVMAFTVYSGRI